MSLWHPPLYTKESTKIKPVRNYWVVINKRNEVAHWSLAATKKQSITVFLGTNSYTWQQCEDMGWRAEKVNIHFEKTNNGK